jgi:soluble lytic murein transglycosylase
MNSMLRKAGVFTGFFAIIVILLIAYTWRRPVSWTMEEINAFILEASETYHVDSNLVSAVIWKESRYYPDATGAAGELGLMQIRNLAASEWAEAENIRQFEHRHVLHPRTNTLAGTWYLRKMLDRYSSMDDPLVYALADYNAGRKNVLRWLKSLSNTNSAEFLELMDFPTTRQYIFDVSQKYQDLSAEDSVIP